MCLTASLGVSKSQEVDRAPSPEAVFGKISVSGCGVAGASLGEMAGSGVFVLR